MPQVLIVADALPTVLFSDYPDACFFTAAVALEQLFLKSLDIVFVDIAIPGQEGLRLLETIQYTGAELVLCHAADDPQITEALWYGVRFFISRTATLEELGELIGRIMQRRTAVAEQAVAKAHPLGLLLAELVGELPDIVVRKLQAYATDSAPVLLIGAPGTEWQYIAQQLCQHSLYQRSFYVHYCYGSADLLDLSFLYSAHHGTVVIADVAYFTAEMQRQLKGLLEHTPVPLLLCIYASKSLRALVAAGLFEESLYRLISRREIALPLLRDRADLSQIIQRVLLAVNHYYGLSIGLSDEVLEKLLAYAWPGNIQELYGILAAVIPSADKVVTLVQLPLKIKKASL